MIDLKNRKEAKAMASSEKRISKLFFESEQQLQSYKNSNNKDGGVDVFITPERILINKKVHNSVNTIELSQILFDEIIKFYYEQKKLA